MPQIKLRLYSVHFNQCDRKKCSSLRMKRFNLVKILSKISQLPRSAIILDPFASKEISPSDHDLIARYGLAVIDCSWNKAKEIFYRSFKTGRRLPPLLAANSVNYGKWSKLNSAEALVAALIITGFYEDAKLIMSKFNWGPTFFELNKNIFEQYIEK
ncbi:MAG: DUF367 family protein [Promethearchaeota archaeon]